MTDAPAPAPDIVILGLRRSGTTALWRLFRQDPARTAYDEPFLPLLAQVPRPEPKGVQDEYAALWRRDPDAFRAAFAPVPRPEEVRPGLTPAQAGWLAFLRADGPVAIDVTRCHAKIAALAAALPGAVLVHLHRRARAVVRSHLVPSDGRRLWGLRDLINGRTALTRRRGFDKWGFESLTSPPLHAETARLLAGAGTDLPPPDAPAALRLLAYWLGAYRLAETEGRAVFGPRFVSLAYEDLCQDPGAALARIYAAAGHPAPAIDTGALRRPGPPDPDPRWPALAAEAGFTEAEIDARL